MVGEFGYNYRQFGELLQQSGRQSSRVGSLKRLPQVDYIKALEKNQAQNINLLSEAFQTSSGTGRNFFWKSAIGM